MQIECQCHLVQISQFVHYGVGNIHMHDLPHRVALLIPSLLKVGTHNRDSGCAR